MGPHSSVINFTAAAWKFEFIVESYFSQAARKFERKGHTRFSRTWSRVTRHFDP